MESYILLFCLVFFPLLVWYGLRKKKRLEAESVAQMQARYGDGIVLYDEKTMYYGLRSKGMIQTHEQGGIFVITEDRVHFKSWDYGGKIAGVQVNFDFEIPFERLQGFGQSKKFVAMGPMSSMGGEGLLILQFLDEQGREDELGLLLKQRQREAIACLEEKTGQTAFKRDK